MVNKLVINYGHIPIVVKKKPINKITIMTKPAWIPNLLQMCNKGLQSLKS
jgi:hypothetical protein